MSVLVGKQTRLVVQGFTGSEGSFHASQMIEYGTTVVGGVTPGKGGTKHLDRPVFNTVADAVKEEDANTSIIFVPPAFAADAIAEAVFAGIKTIVCITEGIPVKDMITAKQLVISHGATLIGPNCPGVITPGEAKVGIMPVIGTTHLDAVKLLNADPDTDAIVLIGEIGGSNEEEAAAWIKANVKKPVVAFIAGRTAPPGRRMGHAGAIVSGGKGTAQEKMSALQAAGITVCESPAVIGETMKRLLGK